MIPDEIGRYCNSCKKSVIDFTAKTDEEIQQFVINNLNQSLCGRFKNTQIQRIAIDLPKNIFSIQMPLWMRFLVACLIIFGISIFPFETTIAGKTITATTFYQDEPIQVDTAKKPRILKKKKRRNKYSISFTPVKLDPIIDNLVLGGFGLHQQDNPIMKSIFGPHENMAGEYTFNTAPKEANQDNKSLPQKEHPAPTPFMPDKFILPSVLMFRRKNNNNPMD